MKIPCVILCGGKSSRMGVDKCFLNFKGQSLVSFQFSKMSELFSEVFVSCKNDKFGASFDKSRLIFDEDLSENSALSLNLSTNSTLNSAQNLNSSVNSKINSNQNLNLSKNSSLNSNQNSNFSENSKINSSQSLNLSENSHSTSRKSKDFSPMLALYSVLKHFKRGFVFVIAVDMPFLSKESIERLISSAQEAQIILPKTANKEHFLCGLYESALYPLCLELLCENIHKIRLLTQKVPTKFLEFRDENEFANLNTPQDYERIKNA